MTKHVICIMGPTASGKTDLALKLVNRFPLEIISVDSTMVYRGLDIGVAKPTKEELAKAPHRMIDICDPSEVYSAGQFREDALREIADIQARGKIPLLIGGTMLYFYVLQYGVAPLPSANQTIRKRLTEQGEQLGWSKLHQRLAQIDPKAALKINPNDAQRIQRALEVYEITGFKISELHKNTNAVSNFLFINIVIAPKDRQLLHQRIANRFDVMLQQGLLQEVQKLYDRGDLSVDLPAIRSVGYRQIWQYLSGEIDASTMRDKAIAATRQLAKRQLTWLRRYFSTANAKWFEMSDEKLAETVDQYLSKRISM